VQFPASETAITEMALVITHFERSKIVRMPQMTEEKSEIASTSWAPSVIEEQFVGLVADCDRLKGFRFATPLLWKRDRRKGRLPAGISPRRARATVAQSDGIRFSSNLPTPLHAIENLRGKPPIKLCS
jgi:hypothetical protein